LVDPMTGGMELLEFADDIDEFLDPLGTASGLDLIGPHVDVEVVEAAFEGTQVHFPGAEEFDEVDGVGDDEADGVWGVRTGVSVGCVRVGGIHRVRGWVGDVQNVPLHAGAHRHRWRLGVCAGAVRGRVMSRMFRCMRGRTVTGGAWVCSHLRPLSHQRPNECWVMTRPADPAEEERRMVGPNRTVLAPTASRASSSPPLMPPSGPTTMTMRSGWAEDAGRSPVGSCPAVSPPRSLSAWDSRSCAVSWRTKIESVSDSWRARDVPRTSSCSRGNRDRLACRDAAWSRCSHFAAIFSRFFAGQSAMERSAAHGMTSSTPISVAASMACRSRSPLARACTRTR